jgi:nitrite reductase/ring-hydroxylating ferredoxin subunit
MTYHTAAKINDVAPGSMKAVVANGKKILLANVGGAFFAMQQKCPHLGGNLCKGKLVDKTVTCPLHSATFDLATGEVLEGAHLLFLKFRTKAAAIFPVKIEGDTVLVEA